MSYVYSRYRYMNYYEIRDTLYQLMAKSKRENKDMQVEVSNVEITSCTKNSELLEIEDKKYEAYDVACKVIFTEDNNVSNLITNNQYLTIIKNKTEEHNYCSSYDSNSHTYSNISFYVIFLIH